MSWNRSSSSEANSNRKNANAYASPSRRHSLPVWLRYSIAGVVVIVGSLTILKMLANEEDEPADRPQQNHSLISAVAPKIAVKQTKQESIEKESRIKYWESPTTNGLTEAQIRKWFAVRRPKPHFTNDTARTAERPRYAIFDHYSENEIALYLTLDPRSSLIGTPRYDKKFTDDFLKSCEVPIIVNDEDDEYTRDLKRQMIATKIDLRGRMSQGEDLGQILLETRKEIQRLGQVRRELESEVRMKAKSGEVTSEEELDDYVRAANLMLESKGAAPIKLGPVIRRALVRRATLQQTYKNH